MCLKFPLTKASDWAVRFFFWGGGRVTEHKNTHMHMTHDWFANYSIKGKLLVSTESLGFKKCWAASLCSCCQLFFFYTKERKKETTGAALISTTFWMSPVETKQIEQWSGFLWLKCIRVRGKLPLKHLYKKKNLNTLLHEIWWDCVIHEQMRRQINGGSCGPATSCSRRRWKRLSWQVAPGPTCWLARTPVRLCPFIMCDLVLAAEILPGFHPVN